MRGSFYEFVAVFCPFVVAAIISNAARSFNDFICIVICCFSFYNNGTRWVVEKLQELGKKF